MVCASSYEACLHFRGLKEGLKVGEKGELGVDGKTGEWDISHGLECK